MNSYFVNGPNPLSVVTFKFFRPCFLLTYCNILMKACLMAQSHFCGVMEICFILIQLTISDGIVGLQSDIWSIFFLHLKHSKKGYNHNMMSLEIQIKFYNNKFYTLFTQKTAINLLVLLVWEVYQWVHVFHFVFSKFIKLWSRETLPQTIPCHKTSAQTNKRTERYWVYKIIR